MATRVRIYRGTTKEVNRKLLLAILMVEAIIIAIVWFARNDLSDPGLPSEFQTAPVRRAVNVQNPSESGVFSISPTSAAARRQG